MRRGSAGPKRQSMPLGQISKHEFILGLASRTSLRLGAKPNRNRSTSSSMISSLVRSQSFRGPRRLVCRDAWAFSPQISQIYG